MGSWLPQHAAAWLIVALLIAAIGAMVWHPIRQARTPAAVPKVEVVPSDRPDRKSFEEWWIDDSGPY
jgi:hypothetical protein